MPERAGQSQPAGSLSVRNPCHPAAPGGRVPVRIKILLDDFGTGFSSLAYLGKLPIDVIKIDQSFVRTAEHDGYAVIGAILSIARAMGLQVTAEGVETQTQRNALSVLGVHRLQGYLISRPMPDASVADWLTMARAA